MRKLQQDDLVLCSGSLRRLDLPDKAAVASGAGFQGISVYLHEVRDAVPRWVDVASLRRMLDDLGLAVAEIDGQVSWLPGEPSSERAASVDEALEVASGLAARSLTALEWNGHRVGVDLDAAFVVDAFGELCSRAASQELLVHIEYFPFSGIPDLSTALAIANGRRRARTAVSWSMCGTTSGAPTAATRTCSWPRHRWCWACSSTTRRPRRAPTCVTSACTAARCRAREWRRADRSRRRCARRLPCTVRGRGLLRCPGRPRPGRRREACSRGGAAGAARTVNEPSVQPGYSRGPCPRSASPSTK